MKKYFHSTLCLMLSFISICFASVCSQAQPITVGTGGDYSTLSAAASSLVPGDTVIILNQTFSNGTQFLNNVSGTAGAPIVILAQTTHVPVFQGGSEGIHLVDCNYMELNGLVFDGQTGNGFNADDGGDYSTPSNFLTFRNCIFRNIAQSGNHDLLKLSGIDDFLVEGCLFINGNDGGAGIDMVGCHDGIIQDNHFNDCGVTGIQAKGGSENILIRRNIFRNISQRAINAGGSTGLQFFRPPLPNGFTDAFEAANIEIYANLFIGSWAPIAYATARDVRVRNNTFYAPQNWVIRILQDNMGAGFIPCRDNEFSNNIVYLLNDLTEVNIGSGTLPATFTFTNNLWYNASSGNWTPNLPVTDPNQIIADPNFENVNTEDFALRPGSQAIGMGFPFGDPATDFFGLPYNTPPSRGAFSFDQVLAIDDLRFRAQAVEQGVQLNWHTIHNQKQLRIERSADARHWKGIGAAMTDRNTGKGTFIDHQPMSGINYYRLGYENLPGAYEYSQILIVKWDQPLIHIQMVYPNPANDQLFVDLSNIKFVPHDMTIRMTDLLNREVVVHSKINDDRLEVDMRLLSPGIYFLQVGLGGFVYVTQVVKRE